MSVRCRLVGHGMEASAQQERVRGVAAPGRACLPLPEQQAIARGPWLRAPAAYRRSPAPSRTYLQTRFPLPQQLKTPQLPIPQ